MTFDDFYSKYKTVPHFVANKYKDRGIEYDDLVQLAMIGMYNAYLSLEKAKNELSYIIQCAKAKIFREFDTISVRKRSGKTVSIDKERLNGKNMLDLLGIDDDSISFIDSKIVVKDFCRLLDDDLTEVFQMKMDGYTITEITKQLGYPSRHVLERKLRKFKREFKEVYAL